MRRPRIRGLAADRARYAVGKQAVLIGDGGNDAQHEFILHREAVIGLERAIVSFGPDVRARSLVDELDGEAQRGTRLPEATFHHIARLPGG